MATSTEELRIERLLWRAGFGARPGEARRLARRGLGPVVDDLLAGRGPELTGPPARINGQPLNPIDEYGHDSLWWLDRVVRTGQPLIERMTLNWHDHFAVSNDKVGDVKLMMTHYSVLRAGALGSFRDLMRNVMHDGAMQIFLDLAGSNKDSPNENFARELLELFTLGVNNGYTEKDIREAARALTGYTFDYDAKKFGYDAEYHDRGVKTIFGKKGRFTADDVINLAIDHPKHAEYLVTKLWGYFTPRPAPRSTVQAMVRAYRKSGTQIRPVLSIILRHPTVYADLTEPDQVKPPLVYVAGMLRRTRRGVTNDAWVWRLNNMGQVPFYPPNVAGWDQDTAWLSPATIRARFEAASEIIDNDKSIEDGSIKGTQTAKEAITSAFVATGLPYMSPRTRKALERYSTTSVADKKDESEIEHYFPERQRVLRHLMLAGPDAQVA
jgi:uncharacterized protein (DUF1800 family)